MSDQLPFHVPPHLPLHPPKALVPAEPVLALQLDGNGRYHKLSAGGLVPAERCWLHLDYSADNQKIIVPNSSITSGSITNVNANNTRRVDIVVAISYEDSIKNAKDVLTNIINSNPKVLKDKGFGISVTDLAETSVKLGVNVWAKSSDYGSLKAELLEEIKIKFDEVGITIPYSKNVYQQIKN
jgi:hypothetical protein